MLREFVRCNSLEERIELIDNSAPKDWSESELNTVCEIIGIADRVDGMDAEEILEVARAELFNKIEANIETMTTMEKISKMSEEEEPGAREDERQKLLRGATASYIGER